MKYSELVGVYQQLEATTKRLEKTKILSGFLTKLKDDEIDQVILLLEGRVFPAWDQREIGVASKMIVKVIASATGASAEKVVDEWKNTGDLGETANNLVKKKSQSTLFSQQLTVKKVFDNIHKLADIEGTGSVDIKISLLKELLTSAKNVEARYLVRTVMGDLRIGLGSGTLRDSTALAFFPQILYKSKDGYLTMPSNDLVKTLPKNVKKISSAEDNFDDAQYVLAPDEKIARDAYKRIIDAVQQAYDLTNDFAKVCRKAKKGFKGLKLIEMQIGVPVKVMLAIKSKTISEALEATGTPAQIEYKYDGFRMQIHRTKNKVHLFTRRLEEVTTQFPDVVEYVLKYVSGENFILDGEVVGYDPKTKKYLSFQNISQRIRRKYGIEAIKKQVPVVLNVFDLIAYRNKSTISMPFSRRREILEKIITHHDRKIAPATKLISSSDIEIKKFFLESKKNGNEGIMIKKLDAPYKPGARVGYMIKYKEAMETLDVVITGAEWGEGKRANWLSSFRIGIRKGDQVLEIGKVGTGFKEKGDDELSFDNLTKLLAPLIIKEKGKEVTIKPAIVLEVDYEEIQESTNYSSGYALRFPRGIRLRQDKGLSDISSIKLVKDLAGSQR